MSSLAIGTALKIAVACTPHAGPGQLAVSPDVVMSVAYTESALDPLAIHDNATGATVHPATKAEAVAHASRLITAGHRPDLGLMQINAPANLARTGLTVETAFDACASIHAGAQILLDGYQGGATVAAQQAAILRTFSAYNTGRRPRPASAKQFATPTRGTGIDPAKSSRRCGRKAVLYTLALLLTAPVIQDRAQASLVSPDTFAKLAAACVPSVAPEKLAAVARTKSGFDDTVVHDNATGRTYRPATRAEAIQLATELAVVDRHSVDLGLMQINSTNLPDLHLTITDAFDPCHSLTAGARFLVAHYAAPATGGRDPEPAELDRGRRRGVALTGAAFTALIARCAGPSPPIDLLTRIVMHESGGNPTASNVNRNGSIDYGLAQINSSNLVWLGETPASILDPCRNIAAEARILRAFSSYATGSPDRGFIWKPPGQSVSYVESLADTKYRGAGNRLPGAAASLQRLGSARLISMSTK